MNRHTIGLIIIGAGAGGLAALALSGALHRSPPAAAPQAALILPAYPESAPLFEDATRESGVGFIHQPGPISLFQVPQVTGSGCAFLDFDQDGDLDIFLINQAGGAGYEGISGSVPEAASGLTNRLYRQEADGNFADATAGSGLDVVGIGQGVAVGDVNNDGFPDVYLSCYGSDRLFLNRRDGSFVDVSQAAGIDNLLWGTSCIFVDFDRDGWLDLFVANYVDYHPTRRCADPGGEQEFCNPKEFVGTPHKLFHNETGKLDVTANNPASSQPQVRFRDVSLSSGIARKAGPGLGVVAADFDGDGWPDLFVANDGAANFLWINQHDGTFREEAVLRGAAYDLTGRAQANMGIAVGDVDGDGRLDLFVTHFQGEMNAFYLNKSADGFEESAGAAGIGVPGLEYTKWGTAFFDIDHDGDLDLALVNGRVKRSEPKAHSEFAVDSGAPARGWGAYAEPNQLFLNDGHGHFAEQVSPTETFCHEPGVSRGLAVGDVDNDGDLDLLVTTVGGPARVYRNVARKQGHWLMARVIEPALGGRDAGGAMIRLRAGERSWLRLANPGFSYLSSNDPRVHFGLGTHDKFDEITVTWADGVEEFFPGGDADRLLILRRGGGRSP